MGYGIRTRFISDLNQPLGDQRARDRGAQQIFALVDSVGVKHGKHKITHKFLAQIINVDFLDAHCLRLGTGGLYLFALPDISGECHNLAAVVVL